MITVVASTLQSPPVVRVLARLHAESVADCTPEHIVTAEARRLGHRARADLYRRAQLAVRPDVGTLLYALTLGKRAATVVEFGTSLGFSTIFLAAALRDLGGGDLITTELQPEKARKAQENLADAGLFDLVEVREGDALETLRDLDAAIDLLFLDGWNDLYLPLLQLLEPQLTPGSLVAADLSANDPDLVAYAEYVNLPDGGYVSIELPLDAGVLLSVRVA
jgi:predicted O-methyltransferase YrrM